MTPSTVSLIEAEYRRYKALAEGAVEQLQPAELETRSPATNSVATIMWHIAGYLASRFTDFLTSDGEKSWRFLSIPPGESADYNANPTAEKAADYVRDTEGP
jgi:Protein of unknown function (DUF1572)